LEKRRAVLATFALTVRELTATGFASRYAIAEELNRRKVPTERGGRWHYTSVVRMLRRAGMDKPAYGVGAGAANRWAALVYRTVVVHRASSSLPPEHGSSLPRQIYVQQGRVGGQPATKE
jgi:hypothetical protein